MDTNENEKLTELSDEELKKVNGGGRDAGQMTGMCVLHVAGFLTNQRAIAPFPCHNAPFCLCFNCY